MIDPVQLVREFLLSSNVVQALIGSDVFGEILPEHYDPTGNAAIVVSLKGGAGHPEIPPLMEAEVQVKGWGGVNQYALARAAYAACYDSLTAAGQANFSGIGTLLTAVEISTGRGDADPDSGWATVTGAFKIIAVQTVETTLPSYVDDTQTVQEYLNQQLADDGAVLDGGSGS